MNERLCDTLWPNIKDKEGKMQAYCMKCRKKVEIKNPKSITMRNKSPATQGVCLNCGTIVSHKSIGLTFPK